MPKIADLCRRIQEEPDPEKFAALVNELIRLLDEERAIKTRPAASLHDRSFPKLGANSSSSGGVTDARNGF